MCYGYDHLQENRAEHPSIAVADPGGGGQNPLESKKNYCRLALSFKHTNHKATEHM